MPQEIKPQDVDEAEEKRKGQLAKEVWPYEDLIQEGVHSAEPVKGVDVGADPASKPMEGEDEESDHASESEEEEEELPEGPQPAPYPDQNNPIPKPNLSPKAAKKFTDQLELLLAKANKLRNRKDYIKSKLVDDMYFSLSEGFRLYQYQYMPKDEFKDLCEKEFRDAKESKLKDHRDLFGKVFWLNLGLAIAGLGIGFLIVGLIFNGRHVFFPFNTDSINEVEKVENCYKEICPGG